MGTVKNELHHPLLIPDAHLYDTRRLRDSRDKGRVSFSLSTLTQPGWHRAAGNGHPLRPDLLHALFCTCSSKWAAHQRPSSPRPEVNISTPSASHLAASLPYSLACATGPAVFRMLLRFSTRAYLQNTGCSRDGPECWQQAGRSLCGPLLWGSLCVVSPLNL